MSIYKCARNTLVFLVAAVVLAACGGGSGGGSACDDALTVSYLQNIFVTDFPGFTESNSTIVYTDGNQGNTFDIDVVGLSRISHSDGNSLAFSYTIHGTAIPPADTYIAFYIDTDKNSMTGMSVDTMGADALVVNAAGGSANGYYLWNQSTVSWVKQPILGTLASNASYYQGCTYSTTVYAPLYTGLSSLYGANVRGVVLLITISGSDPTSVTSIPDGTAIFDFTVP